MAIEDKKALFEKERISQNPDEDDKFVKYLKEVTEAFLKEGETIKIGFKHSGLGLIIVNFQDQGEEMYTDWFKFKDNFRGGLVDRLSFAKELYNKINEMMKTFYSEVKNEVVNDEMIIWFI